MLAYAGDADAGAELVAPLRTVGAPAIDTLATMPARDLAQVAGDPPGPVPGVGDTALLRELDVGGLPRRRRSRGADRSDQHRAAAPRRRGGPLGPRPRSGRLDRRAVRPVRRRHRRSTRRPGRRCAQSSTDIKQQLAPSATGQTLLSFAERQPGVAGRSQPRRPLRLREVSRRFDPEGLIRANHAVSVSRSRGKRPARGLPPAARPTSRRSSSSPAPCSLQPRQTSALSFALLARAEARVDVAPLGRVAAAGRSTRARRCGTRRRRASRSAHRLVGRRVPAARGRAVGVAGAVVGAVVLDERRLAPRRHALAAQQPDEAAAVAVGDGVDPRQLGEGRIQVDVLGDAGDRPALRTPGPSTISGTRMSESNAVILPGSSRCSPMW